VRTQHDQTVAEGKQVQFRAELFNFPNHANYRLPDIDISSPTFNHITEAQDLRRVQFALKFPLLVDAKQNLWGNGKTNAHVRSPIIVRYAHEQDHRVVAATARGNAATARTLLQKSI
jgi:hypothetical protein